MRETGWIGEAPDEKPAMPVTEMLLRNKERGPGDTLETALARSRGADARQAREEANAARDPDEYAASLVTRGYRPGMVSQLSQRLGDTIAELEAEREKIERGERVQAIAAREHAAGRVNALGMLRMADRDFGDQATVERLERRCEGLRRRITEAQEMISPPQQRDPDPVESASRRANAAFREVTRQKLASAAQPQAPRPFGSVSRGAAGTEHTGPDCWVCAEGRKRDAAKRDPGPDITRARRLEDLGYGESSPGGCPPCSACHYVACRCGQPGLRQYPGGRTAAVYA